MKKYIALAIVCCAAAPVLAQKVDSKEVPAAVKKGLETSMKVKDAKWEKEEGNYEASFKKDGKETSVVLDQAGTVLETEVEISSKELPVPVMGVLNKDYIGFKIEEAAKITAKVVVTYEAEIEKGEESYELIFDANGKVLKKEKKEEGEEKDNK